MSYNELLSGIIYKDEQIVSSDYMDYISLSTYDDSFNLLHTKPAGKAILTDKRMLLMSTQYYESKCKLQSVITTSKQHNISQTCSLNFCKKVSYKSRGRTAFVEKSSMICCIVCTVFPHLTG